MSENIKGTITIDYEIHPNNTKGNVDKYSIIVLAVAGTSFENSILNTPQNILKFIYEDLHIKLFKLKPVVDVLKENLKNKEQCDE